MPIIKKTIENLLLSNPKISGTLVQQTQTKRQETLKIKLSKSRESFSFDIPSHLEDGEWRLRLTS